MMNKPAPLPTYDQALAKVLSVVSPLKAETVLLADALGRVLAEEILADRDQPPFDRSAMDGFAVRSSEVVAGREFVVDGKVSAGGAPDSFQKAVPAGMVRRIATGSPLPVGCDSMIPIEQAVVVKSEAGERVRFNVEKVQPWQNIHRRASDVKMGEPVVQAGTKVGPQHIGLAATSGVTKLGVGAMPRVTLLTTGDEVVDPKTPTDALGPQQIRNSNGPMLSALIGLLGGKLLSHKHLPDNLDLTVDAARQALEKSDIVITNGGVSVGERDYLPEAWKKLGLDVVIHGVNIQPGKPVFVATDPRGKIVLGLPGNPVSVLCTAHLFVWPVIRAMQAVTQPLPWRKVMLAESVKPNSRRELFRVARLTSEGTAAVIGWQGSGDLAHTANGDVWVRLPLQDTPVEAGASVWSLRIVG